MKAGLRPTIPNSNDVANECLAWCPNADADADSPARDVVYAISDVVSTSVRTWTELGAVWLGTGGECYAGSGCSVYGGPGCGGAGGVGVPLNPCHGIAGQYNDLGAVGVPLCSQRCRRCRPIRGQLDAGLEEGDRKIFFRAGGPG